MEKKKYIDTLERQAQKDGVSYDQALNNFLDYLLELYSIDKYSGTFEEWRKSFQASLLTKPDFGVLTIIWNEDVAQAMEKGEWLDVFGQLYEEMYLSRGKASKTGQFFTPKSVSDFMSAIIQPDKNQATTAKIKGNRVNDCAAGSGRLLLAHYIDVSKVDHHEGRKYYYVAQDSDPVACKMCALNMMIHGMNGEVICGDTLSQDTPSFVYHINEIRYPFPTPYYSVNKLIPKK